MSDMARAKKAIDGVFGRSAGMEHEFELWQDGIMVAAAGSDNEDEARREIWHYAMQYVQDGPIEIKSPTGSDPRMPSAK